EEEIGREGFFGAATHLYRKNPPTDWVELEGDLRPQAWDFNKLESAEAWSRSRVLHNAQTQISIVSARGSDPSYMRNADGDEIQFIHEGEGVFESDFGSLAFK